MTASLSNPIFLHSGLTWADRSSHRPRPHVRKAVKLLALAFGDSVGESLRQRLLDAEQAAIAAELRIAELENELERIRRETRAGDAAMAEPEPAGEGGGR